MQHPTIATFARALGLVAVLQASGQKVPPTLQSLAGRSTADNLSCNERRQQVAVLLAFATATARAMRVALEDICSGAAWKVGVEHLPDSLHL